MRRGRGCSGEAPEGRHTRLSTFLALVGLLGLAPQAQQAPVAGGAPKAGWRVVPPERLLQAMGEVRGYELTATANAPRLQADVVLALVHEAQTQDAERRPIFIGHREWYEAFLSRTGLSPSQAPICVQRPYEVGQDMVIDYRREAVIEDVLEGPQPRSAANVRIFWERVPKQPDQYSYDDTRSNPNLRVIQDRLITYRLVEYADRLWYANVSGVHGRPTSGPLGVLFDLIGEARVEETRSAIVPDGVQVLRGRASKWGIERTETMTVWPDGHAEAGVPADRSDLVALQLRLLEPLAIRFRPLSKQP